MQAQHGTLYTNNDPRTYVGNYDVHTSKHQLQFAQLLGRVPVELARRHPNTAQHGALLVIELHADAKVVLGTAWQNAARG